MGGGRSVHFFPLGGLEREAMGGRKFGREGDLWHKKNLGGGRGGGRLIEGGRGERCDGREDGGRRWERRGGTFSFAYVHHLPSVTGQS